jgi:hypothetical protein
MKSTKNEAASSDLNTADATAAGIGKADPVPKVGAPRTPIDFVAAKLPHGTKIQPLPDVIKAAGPSAKEIAASKTYPSDFGAAAPAAETVATNVAFAAAWSAQYTLAENWFLYVKEQTQLAWAQANPQLDDLLPAFNYARSHNDAIGTKYPSTAKLFDARAQPSVKGAAVRASKKAAKKTSARTNKATAAPAAAPATESEAPAAPPPVPYATSTTAASAKN